MWVLDEMTHRSKRQAEWRLRTYLKFPWRPLIDILGTTVYTLDPVTTKVRCHQSMTGLAVRVQTSRRTSLACVQVVKHIEGWNVTGTAAIAQMFRASDRSKVPFLRER